MSEMHIKSDEYSTLWHVDVDSAEELLGEFADVESLEEEEDEEPEEVEEENEDTVS